MSAPTPPALPGSRTIARTALSLAAGALAVSLIAPGASVAAQPKLSNGTVTPASGTTTTTFVFAVTYSGTKPATSVVALVANSTVTLSLVPGSGTTQDGRFSGSALLEAGSWPVVFQATTGPGPDPKPLALSQPVVVTLPPPTPTPQPTAPPTPVVTPTPLPTSTATPVPTPIAPTPLPTGATTPSPASGEPSGSGEPTPFGTTVGSQSGAPTPSTSPTPGAGAGGSDDVAQQLSTFLTGGVTAIGLLAAVGFAAIYADRRRNRATAGGAHPGEPAGSAPGGSATSAPRPGAAAPRPRAGWEDYALDDEPIGTVEYEPPRPGE